MIAAARIPVTTLLFALGLDSEEILDTYFNIITFSRIKDGWRKPFDASKMRGTKALVDLIDADSGDVIVEAGKKLTARAARDLEEKGVKALKVSNEDLIGEYIAEEIVSTETGEIFMEAGDEITEENLVLLEEMGYE